MLIGHGLRIPIFAPATMAVATGAPPSPASQAAGRRAGGSEAAPPGFSVGDQGSRRIPWAWIDALKRDSGVGRRRTG